MRMSAHQRRWIVAGIAACYLSVWSCAIECRDRSTAPEISHTCCMEQHEASATAAVESSTGACACFHGAVVTTAVAVPSKGELALVVSLASFAQGIGNGLADTARLLPHVATSPHAPPLYLFHHNLRL